MLTYNDSDRLGSIGNVSSTYRFHADLVLFRQRGHVLKVRVFQLIGVPSKSWWRQ